MRHRRNPPSGVLLALAAAATALGTGTAWAQGTPPADIPACTDAYVSARLESLLMPVLPGDTTEACITVDPAVEKLTRISCFAAIEGEMADHPEIPVPFPCSGIGASSSCIRIPEMKIVAAGWKPAANGQWSYCVSAESSMAEGGWRYLQIFAE